MPKPRLSQTISRLLAKRGSVSGLTPPRENPAPQEVTFDNSEVFPSTDTPVTGTETSQESFGEFLSSAELITKPSSEPTALSLFLPQYQPGDHRLFNTLPLELQAKVEFLGRGYGTTPDEVIDRIARLLSAPETNNWTVERAVRFYCDNYVMGYAAPAHREG